MDHIEMRIVEASPKKNPSQFDPSQLQEAKIMAPLIPACNVLDHSRWNESHMSHEHVGILMNFLLIMPKEFMNCGLQ